MSSLEPEQLPRSTRDLVLLCPYCMRVFPKAGINIGDARCPDCNEHDDLRVLEVRTHNDVLPGVIKFMNPESGAEVVDSPIRMLDEPKPKKSMGAALKQVVEKKYTGRNGIPDEVKMKMRTLRKKGKTMPEIAEECDVCLNTVKRHTKGVA